MSDTGRCKTCKHWECGGWTADRLGSCNRFDVGDGSDGQTHISSTNVEGGSNFAYLTTRPDFGCVLWEADSE